MMQTIFQKIMDGEIPSYKIYEDDHVLAFLDIYPDTNGHTLVIPKTYVLDIDSLSESTLVSLLNGVTQVKKILEERLHPDGITLVQNNGMVQEIKHLHIHVKPYYQTKQNLRDIKEIHAILTREQ